jgi:hypothetical protein
MLSIMRYALLASALVVGLLSCSSPSSLGLPQCEQDSLLRGSGDFVDGRWETYSCDVSTRDVPTYEQQLALEKLAECPPVERTPGGEIAVFDDGVRVFVKLSDGSASIPVGHFINSCLR